MNRIIITATVALSLALGALLNATAIAAAQSPRAKNPERALTRAIETAAVATCKVAWIKSGGTGSRSAAYFAAMADCIGGKVAAR
jgi:hypothetical protein